MPRHPLRRVTPRPAERQILAIHRYAAQPRYAIEPLEPRVLLSTVSYTNAAGDNSWNDPANWNTDIVPQPGDDVVISQPGNLQITLWGSVSVNSLTLSGDTLLLQPGAALSTTAGVTNGGTISVSPGDPITVGGNYVQSVGATLSMPGGGPTTVPTTNLLANPHFEYPVMATDGTTAPDGWTAFGTANLITLDAYTGQQSLQTSGPDSGVYQSFPVAPGASYTLSVYAMTPAADHLTGSEAGYIQILYFDSGGNQISALAAPNSVYAEYESAPAGGPLAGSAGTDGWNAFSTAAVAPANAATAQAVLLVNDLNGTGTGAGSVYWDDAQFGPSPAPPSTLSAAMISNSGTITVGPTNTITTSGSFTQTPTGTLDEQLGGAPVTGEYGSVSSTGPATLAGTLQADLDYGYVPSTDDVFTPIEFPSEAGSFANLQLPAGIGYQFQSAVTFTNVVLSAVPTTPLTTTVEADSPIHAVSSNLLGANLNWYDPALTTSQTQQMAKAAGLDAYRFPGGSTTDDYHFNSIANDGQSSVTTIATFAQFNSTSGGTGLATLDYGSASPQEDAAELAYLEGSPTDTTTLGVGIEWNDSAKQWQDVNWGTVGYWASLRGQSPLAANDGLNFLRIKHPAPFSNILYWEVGNEQYGTWEIDHHGTPGPLGVSTGAQHDPATYAAFCAQFASYAAEITAAAGHAPISIGIDSGSALPIAYHFWTPSVLTDGAALGFVPGFISDHDYMQQPGEENDETLLESTVSDPSSMYDWSTRYDDYESILQQALGSAAANVRVIATEYNSVFDDPGKQSTSLVNGLFIADSIGSMLESDYSGGFVWDLRDGWLNSDNNSNGLYGWREGGDYGIIGDSHTNTPPSTGAYVPYPGYFAEQLGSKIAQPGGTVVSAVSNYQQLDSYAVMEPNGHLDLLVINANPAGDLTGQFDLQGFEPSGQAQFWQYGQAQDTGQSKSATGASALAGFSTTLALSGNNFSYTFPAYSMTVIDLAPETAPAIATAAAAKINPITGKTASLSVLGSENENDSNLTYLWTTATVPPGMQTPAFTSNGSNASKSTTATFFGLGTYTFLVTVSDVYGASVTSRVTVVVKQMLTTLDIVPASATISIGATQPLVASGFDQFGSPMAATAGWSLVSGSVGTISAKGLYSAGAAAGSATIHARSGSIVASAKVVVVWGSISGMVFNDANADGANDASEKGLGGRTVYLEIAGHGTSGKRATTTSAAGAFSFANLAAGNYVLIVPIPTGWRSTSGSSAGDLLTLAIGEKLANLSFGQTTHKLGQ